MRKAIPLFLLFLLISLSGVAQYTYSYNNMKVDSEKQKPWFDSTKLTYGGGFGVGFGNNGYWNIALSPQVGYELSSKFILGLGISYSHSEERYNTFDGREKHTQNYVGMNLFAHYYPVSWALITLKPEGIRVWDNFSGSGYEYKQEEFVPAVVIGAGVRLKPMFITLNYDLVQNKRNPYGDNIFWSVGFLF